MKDEEKTKEQFIDELRPLREQVSRNESPGTGPEHSAEGLSSSERFARKLLDALSEHIAVLDDDGRILFVNEAWRDFARKNNTSLDGLLEGANYLGVCDQARGDDAVLAVAFAEGARSVMRCEIEQFTLEYPCHSPWEERWFIGRVTRFGGDGPVRIVVSHQNITERKQAEENLRESEEKYRTLFEESFDGLFITSPEGRILDMNRKGVTMFGYDTKEEIMELDLEQDVYAHPPDRKRILAMVDTQGTAEYEVVVKKKGGEEIVTYCSLTAVRDEAGKITSYRGIIRNITSRKEAEESLRESELRYRTIIDNTKEGIILQEASGKIVSWNKTAERVFGISEREALEHTSLNRQWNTIREDGSSFPGSDHPSMQTLHTGLPCENVVMGVPNSSGGVTWININTTPLFEESESKPYAVVITFSDITARKMAEDILHKYSFMVGATPDLMSFVDKDYVYQAVNEAYLYAHQKTSHEILGHSIPELHGEEVFNAVIKPEMDRSLTGEQIRYAAWFDFAGLGRRFVDVIYNPYRDRQDTISGVLVVVHDITERKLAELRLQEEYDRAEKYLEVAGVMLVGISPDQTINLINRKGCELLGYSRSELLGRNWFDLCLPERVRDKVRHIFNSLMGGDLATFGRTEEFVITHTGEERTIAWHNVLVQDAAGKIIGSLSSGEDITERKQAEMHRDRLEAQLRQAQKMEAIGTLAGGIAHDFNNILGIIMGNAELTLFETPIESPLHEYLQQITKATLRARDLVRQILTFSRKTEHDQRPLSITPIIKESLKLLRSSLPATIEIRQQIAVPVGEDSVLADPTQIHQVLVNLCANSSHAMRETGGILGIAYSSVDFSEGDLDMPPELAPGSYVELTVSDTGHGMSKEVMERIFEPYFTTKTQEEGTGLGLAVVHGIVAKSSGAIIVASVPGKGSTFRVFLPKWRGNGVDLELEIQMPLQRGSESILLVDDEGALLNAIGKMLDRLGYTVVARTAGAEALQEFRARPDAFDLVITDYTMPEMTGVEVAREMMRVRPDIPVILCTGFNERINERKALEMGVRGFVMKPITIHSLAEKVRMVLDKEQD